MQPGEVLRHARRENEATLAQMAEWLGTSHTRVSQWERGDPIPFERAQVWAEDPELPDWVRQMARQVLVAQLREEHAALGARIDRVEHILTSK